MSAQHLWTREDHKEYKLPCNTFPCPQKKHEGQEIEVNHKNESPRVCPSISSLHPEVLLRTFNSVAFICLL